MADDDMTPEQESALLELAKVLFKQNPKEFKKFAKKQRPDLHVPEIETEEEMLKALSERDTRIEDLAKKLDEKDRIYSVLETRKNLSTEGYTKEEIEKLEDLIKAKRVSNYDDARVIFDAERKIAEPTPGRFQPLEQPSIKKEDLDSVASGAWSRTEAVKAIDDIRFGRVKID